MSAPLVSATVVSVTLPLTSAMAPLVYCHSSLAGPTSLCHSSWAGVILSTAKRNGQDYFL